MYMNKEEGSRAALFHPSYTYSGMPIGDVSGSSKRNVKGCRNPELDASFKMDPRHGPILAVRYYSKTQR
jgi:hypothetical protein